MIGGSYLSAARPYRINCLPIQLRKKVAVSRISILLHPIQHLLPGIFKFNGSVDKMRTGWLASRCTLLLYHSGLSTKARQSYAVCS